MTGEQVLALALFAFVMSVTPGPNNAMLLASGVNVGFRRTLPLLTGIIAGVAVMNLAVGLGLGSLFERVPELHTALKVAGGAYLLWLAWKLARAGGPKGAAAGTGRPMGFVGGALFQWLNPKAYVMVITAVTAYVPADGSAWTLLVMVAVFAAVGAPSVAVWAGFGTALRRWLREPGRVRAFNVGMAALLVLSLWPILAM